MAMNQADAWNVIDALSSGIPALFAILEPDEREQLREMLGNVLARNELRNPWFAEWFKDLLAEHDAAKARTNIERSVK